MLSLGFFSSISRPARLELGQRAAVQSPLLMASSTLAFAVIRDSSHGDIVGRESRPPVNNAFFVWPLQLSV